MGDRELIDAAIAAGRVTVIPPGQSSRQPKPAKKCGSKVRPESCGSGFQLLRHRFLDEMDGDWS